MQKITGIKEFFFEKDASVIFEGKISLSPGIHFRGHSFVSNNVVIDTGCVLNNVTVGENCNIRSHSIILNSKFGPKNTIGPHCFVRDNTLVGANCIIGSHVEVARSKIGSQTKISHQAFVGDAIIEDEVIIGAGTVFCNYDGKSKQSSYIGTKSTIGSGSMLVAPIRVGKRVVVGAGSVITKDVPDKSKIIQYRK